MTTTVARRRVLIVCPRFAPSASPDQHRARLALPHLPALGWEPTVLAVAADEVEAPLDPLLAATLPSDVEICRVRPWPLRTCRRLGFGHLGLRCRSAIRRRGDQLLGSRRFDAVFLTGTVFDLFPLAARWHRRHGLPVVLDWQDPWVTEAFRSRDAPSPPGGWLRYRLATAFDRQREPRALRAAARVVSVSARYIEALADRYAWWDRRRAIVLPLPAAEEDLAVARRPEVHGRAFDPADGRHHWVYAGALSPAMVPAVAAFCAALQRYRAQAPEGCANLSIHFLGTSYAPPGRGRPVVGPVAAAAGVGDLVREQTDRLPYFAALRALLHAQAVLLFGSADGGYVPSKLPTLLLTGRPLLAVTPPTSAAAAALASLGGGIAAPPDATAIAAAWFEPRAWERIPALDRTALAAHLAPAHARTLADVFHLATLSPA
jgi:hypothetical protein